MSRFLLITLVCLVGLPLVADDAAVPNDDAKLKQDYADMHGAWQRKTRDKNGRELTVTKSELRGTSVVTVKDADGKVLHSHHSQYELQRTGKVRIFKYWNRTVTDGPDAGRVSPETRSYVYRIVGDRFYEIHGVLTEDEKPPVIFIWNRVKAEPEVTSTRSRQTHDQHSA